MVRIAAHPIDPLFTRRWSPRAMSGEPVSREALLTLLEAARWAPSSGNGQPWRFVWALRGTPAFDALFATLAPGNQEWAHAAGALVLVSTRTVRDNGKPWGTARFDAGAAWMSLALQGTLSGLVVHGMAGFDPVQARAAAALPPEVEPQAMVAVGHHGRAEDLPEKQRAIEAPNDRLPLGQVAFEGRYGG
jgi:nitroreductase